MISSERKKWVTRKIWQVINKLRNTLISTKIQYTMSQVFEKPQQISQSHFNSKEGDSISTKMISFIIEKVFEELFSWDLEFLFWEKDIAFTEFAI